MAKNSFSRPKTIHDRLRFALVASEFNPKYVDALIDRARKELMLLAPRSSASLYRVPGAFEIPILVRELARQKKADGILAIGVIVKGKTDHATNLARSVTDALQRIAIDTGVPIINAVLSLNSEAQARERCFGDKINRGTEAARAAVAITETISELRRS